MELRKNAGPWSCAVVIPARNEEPSRVLKVLRSLEQAAPREGAEVLAILVVNSSPASAERDHPRHRQLLDQLTTSWKSVTVTTAATVSATVTDTDADAVTDTVTEKLSRPLDLFILDHFSTPSRLFPEKGGVGLARKVGCDAALALWREGLLFSPWIRTTDADAQVGEGYFTDPTQESGAIISHFSHRPEGPLAQQRAILLYEIYLRYVRLGMNFAKSTYDYHSIGSLISVHAETYQKVSGFPDRQAGEDFYFLNKIRKLGPIQWGPSGRVELAGRESDRVPFGTGKSVEKILEFGENQWPFYAPATFEILGEVLANLSASEGAVEKNINVFCTYMRERKLLERFQNIANQCRSVEQWHRRSVELFDAFEQLKFLHYLRDNGHPARGWGPELARAPFAQCEGDSLEASLQKITVRDEAIPFG